MIHRYTAFGRGRFYFKQFQRIENVNDWRVDNTLRAVLAKNAARAPDWR